MAGDAAFVELDVEHPLGDHASIARAGHTGILNRMLEVEEHTGLRTHITFVDQDRAALQQISMALQRQVDHGIQ